jgi:hypothetical protein
MKNDKPDGKEERLAEALRANLRRRKAPKKEVGKHDLPPDATALLDVASV